jgi:hypothetical protein
MGSSPVNNEEQLSVAEGVNASRGVEQRQAKRRGDQSGARLPVMPAARLYTGVPGACSLGLARVRAGEKSAQPMPDFLGRDALPACRDDDIPPV